MASKGNASQTFQRTNSSSCASFNSSFSIRSILNLPEENAEECNPSSSDASPSDGCSVSPAIVPRVARPWREFAFVPQLQSCVHSDPFGPYPGACIGSNISQKMPSRPMRKKKQRPLFSPHQIRTMEKEFDKHRYITEEKRAQLASKLNLTETQVKTWFQNRRNKTRKETRDKDTTSPRIEPWRLFEECPGQCLPRVQGNPFHSTIGTTSNSLYYPIGFAPHYRAISMLPTYPMNPTFFVSFVSR